MILRTGLSVLLLFHLLASTGQVFNVMPYSTEDGLIQSQVRAILQDKQGYLWLGTHRGISKFDSRSFTPFQPLNGFLPGNFLTALIEDPDGLIWMGTDKGLARFDGKNLVHVHPPNGQKELSVISLAIDYAGALWLGTSSAGLFVCEKGKSELKPIAWPLGVGKAVNALCAGLGDTIWIGASDGLYYSAGNQIHPHFNGSQSLSGEILTICRDSRNWLWLGLNEGLLCRQDRKWAFFGEKDGLPNRTVYCLAEDKDKGIWTGTGKGIARWANDRFTPLIDQNRLLDFKIRSVCLDQEGNIWFGTDGGGIRKVTQGIFSRFDMNTGLSSNLAKSFVEDAQGRLWISTYDQGITVLENDRAVAYFSEENGLGDKDISFSYRDWKGQLWFCSYGGGITRYDGAFKVLRQRDGLMSNTVYCITQVADNLWLMGGQNGVSLFDGRRFLRTLSAKDGMLGEVVFRILKDQKGRIWFGSNAGLSRLETVPGETGSLSWTHFPAPKVLGANVIALQETPDGRVWAGSNTGVYVWSEDAFYPVPLSDAPGANAIVSMVLDTDSLLWIGTENGIYRIAPLLFQPGAPMIHEHFTQKDGMPSLECNGNAAYLDQQGNIWFGTSEGAIRRPPGAERARALTPPRIHISRVRPPQETSWEALGFVTDQFSGLPVDLKLPHRQNRLTFEFIGISFKNPQQIEYRFQLVGLDQSFSLSTRETSVSYSNLRAGKYTFVVEARNETQPWETAPNAAFSFEIKPPFFATWQFILVALAVLGSSAWGGVRYVTRERRRQLEEKRLREKAERLQLEQQALYAMMNPHFTFNALQSIQFFILRQDKIQANKFLSSFAKLVRKNLESTQSEFIPLAEEVERLELYLSLEKMRFQEKFNYQIKVDEDLDAHHTMMLPMILQPFVENSIRHGIMPKQQGGEILVSLRSLDALYLECLIRDNGIGLEASKKMKENRPNDHVSRGMQITLDRLALFARMTGRNHEVVIQEITGPDGAVAGTEVRMVMPLYLQGERIGQSR